MAVFEEDGTVSVTEHDKKIADLRSKLAASLRLQTDLAEDNVRLRDALKEIEAGDYFDDKVARRIAAKALEGK